jgi:aquaporin Z
MRKQAAEFIGTFALVFTGCAAICTDQLNPGLIGHAGVSATFGLSVLAMIYSIGNVSGAHMNPAVTIGFATARRMPWKETVGYIAAQIAGAPLWSAVLFPEPPSIRHVQSDQP